MAKEEIEEDICEIEPSEENIDTIDSDATPDQQEENGEETSVPIEEEKPAKKRKRSNKNKNEKKQNIIRSFWNVIKTIIRGRILSIDFIIRYWKTILTLLFVILFYISNRYICQQSAAHIKKVEREIHEIRYKSLDMFSRLKNVQSEDSIIKSIERFNLNLQSPEQPPYRIK